MGRTVLPKPTKMLIDFIGKIETGNAHITQGVPSGYDVVHGKIAASHRPQSKVGKRLTQMTVEEVLAWQDSIDRFYYSEAAGFGQVMEDTLRGLRMPPQMKFDVDGQDFIISILLNKRGYLDFINGRMSMIKFGDALAKEWASLPVLSSRVVRADGVVRERGQSYYGDTPMNKVLTSPMAVELMLATVFAEATAGFVKSVTPKPVAKPSLAEEMAEQTRTEKPRFNFWTWLINLLAGA